MAERCQLVDDPGRDLCEDRACDDPVLLEAPQPAGQGVRADAGERGAEFGEAMRAVQEFAHDERCPGSVKEGQEAGDAAFRHEIFLHDFPPSSR